MSFTKLTAAAFLFDMDGTLVDSTASVEHAWAYWARRYSLDLPELLAYSHGRPTIATMEHFGKRFAPGKDWTAEADEMQEFEQSNATSTLPIPGAIELLRQLDGAPWAVVTSAPRLLAESRMQAAGIPTPPLLIPVDELTYGKPNPEGYLKAAGKLGIPPAECIVFEDTPPGVEAGLNAGMQVVGLLTTVTGDRLRTSSLIRDYHDVRLIRQIGSFQLEISNGPFRHRRDAQPPAFESPAVSQD